MTLVIEDELVLPELFSQDSGDLWKDGSTSIQLFNNRDALRTAQKLGKAAEKQRFGKHFKIEKLLKFVKTSS